MEFEDCPKDWKNPQWKVEDNIHNWRNYATENIQDLWRSFSDIQKKSISQCLQIMADKEDYD